MWKIRPRARKLPGQMNKWEHVYADYLETLKLAGQILSWDYEALKFKLAPNTFYTPDFDIITPFAIEIHEIKGFHREDAIVKFKVAAKMYPWAVWKMIERSRNGWETIMEE